MGYASHRFPAMGTEVELLIGGSGRKLPLAGIVEQRISSLEAKWSRFLPDSEVSRLNQARGAALVVSPETRTLLKCSIAAHEATDGAFDPTVADSMVAIGYDRPFDQIGPVNAPVPEPAFGLEGVEVDDESGTARLPLGVRIDPGGIGKGLAADLAVAELLHKGAVNVLVSVGGDLRAHGPGPGGGGWPVSIDQPGSGAAGTTVLIRDGALATSTTLKRRWSTSSGMVHHIIDPATGDNPRSAATVATAIAGTAWWAEAATKPLMISGDAPAGVPWRMVEYGGRVTTGGGFESYVARAA